MKVKMINSVGEHVAGEEYDLDDETSDRFIALGYAEGEITGTLSQERIDALAEGHQEVSV